MARPHNILILQKSNEAPQNLREQLRLKGFPSKTFFSVKGLQQDIEEMPFPIILVECATANAAAVQAIKHLVDLPVLCDFPIVFLADRTERFKESMDRYFIHGVGLNAPCETSQIIEAIERVVKVYDSYLEKLSKISPERYRKLTSREHPAEPTAGQDSASAAAVIHPAYASGAGVMSALSHAFQQLASRKTRLDGGAYTGKINHETLRKIGLYPIDSDLARMVQSASSIFKPRERAHLYRTAYVSGQSARALGLSAVASQKAVVSSFLFAQALRGTKTGLLRVNYILSDSARLRREICNGIKDSAREIASKAPPDIADVINKVAQLVGQEGPLGNDENSQLASAVMAADLTDRVCFNRGFWDPYAARSLLKGIRHGKLSEISPDVLACVVKLLSEAIAKRKPAFLMPPKKRREAMARFKEDENLLIGANETRVEINALEPGMRLSRPLHAFDGRMILSAELLLDGDLIWRLWQLASIQPLLTPTVMREEKSGDAADDDSKV